jgi:hypothetical protein
MWDFLQYRLLKNVILPVYVGWFLRKNFSSGASFFSPQVEYWFCNIEVLFVQLENPAMCAILKAYH